MRRNLPITDRLIALDPDALLSSITDPKGRILDVNADFVRYSGFTREELIGRAHNIVRHPDMPEAAFEDLWKHLKLGRCWRGLVKNRAKNGDAYWVDANVSPRFEGDQLVGYVSVRRAVASTVDLAAVELAYARLGRGELEIDGGHLRPRARGLARLWRQSHLPRLRLTAQLLLAGLPLLLLLLLLVFAQAMRLNEEYQQSAAAERTVTSWVDQFDIIETMQDERGRSLGAVADPGLRSQLDLARQRFDDACRPPDCLASTRIHALRREIDAGRADVAAILLGYAAEIESRLSAMAAQAMTFTTVDHQRAALQLLAAARLREALALERDLVQNAHGPVMGRRLVQQQAHSELARTRLSEMLDRAAASQLAEVWSTGRASTQPYLTGAESGGDDLDRVAAFSTYTGWLDRLSALDDQRVVAWRAATTLSAQESARQASMGALLLVVGSVIALGVFWRLQRRLLASIRKVGDVLQGVAVRGDFHTRVDLPDRGDELSELCRVTDLSLNQVERSLAGVADVLSGVAEGDMQRRLNDSLTGDLARLQRFTNGAVNALEANMHELSGVMKGLAEGRLDVRLSDRVKGQLRGQVNTTLKSLEDSLDALGRLLGDLARGRFGGRLEIRSAGAFGILERDVDQVSHALSEAIGQIGSAVSALADGRLDEKVCTPMHGQFETLRGDINQALDSLSGLVRQAQRTAHAVAGGSKTMQLDSEQLNARSQQQAASLEETAAAMEQLASSVRQADEQADGARREADAVRQLTVTCGESMQAVREAMQRSLNSSAAIAGAVQLIEGIAFQTNLLALNAAVEAARAGEQGRGFAVVASEVRALAGRAAEGAASIRSQIESARSDTQGGAARVESASADLERVLAALRKLHDSVTDIAGATREQASGIQQVNQAVLELDLLTQQNAALAERSAATTLGIHGQIGELSTLLAALRVSADGQHAHGEMATA